MVKDVALASFFPKATGEIPQCWYEEIDALSFYYI
jgi:hypothetical protein